MVLSPKPTAKTSPDKRTIVRIKDEPVIEVSPNKREAIWIVETDSDNDDADQPGPSGLQQNKKDSGQEKKPDDKSQ